MTDRLRQLASEHERGRANRDREFLMALQASLSPPSPFGDGRGRDAEELHDLMEKYRSTIERMKADYVCRWVLARQQRRQVNFVLNWHDALMRSGDAWQWHSRWTEQTQAARGQHSRSFVDALLAMPQDDGVFERLNVQARDVEL